jgi:hypothetical protein
MGNEPLEIDLPGYDPEISSHPSGIPAEKCNLIQLKQNPPRYNLQGPLTIVKNLAGYSKSASSTIL